MSRYDFTGILEWTKIPGWFDLSEAIALQQLVKQLPAGSTLVELGSFKGRSSVAIAAVLPDNCTLHCVDHFQGSAEHLRMHTDISDLQDAFLKNVERFGVKDRIRVLAMQTTIAAEQFAANSVDFVFVDAAHDFESVANDLNAWYPKLKVGGFLVCDDYETGWPEVKQAIDATGWIGRLIAPSLWMHQKT